MQVLATALDPRCKDLIPSNEHRDIHLLVKQAVHEEVLRKNKTAIGVPSQPTTIILEEEVDDTSLSSFDQLRKKNQIASPAETSEEPSLVAEI